MPPPVLQTSRLVLRAPTLDDFEASSRLWADPDVARFTGGKPRTPTDTWDRLFKKAGQWPLLGYGNFMVEDRDTGLVIGEAGFALNLRVFDPAPEPDRFKGAPEIGWAFLPSAQGRGLATEALESVMEWSDANMTASRTVCLIDEAHERSIRLAQRLGYTAYDRAGLAVASVLLMEREKP